MTSPLQLSDQEILNALSISEFAVAIYTSEEIIIQYASDAMIGFWGKDRNVIGKPLSEAVPELVGQEFIQLLQNVWKTGVTYHAKDTPAQLKIDGKLKTYFYDFTYRAVKNEAGEMQCILHTATDVTQLRSHSEQIQFLNEELTVLNEELGSSNEELSSSIQEYAIVNDALNETISELNKYKTDLESLNKELTKAEEMLRFSIDAAKIGTWFIDVKTRELITSDRLKELFGFYPNEEMPLNLFVNQISDEYRDNVAEAIETSIETGLEYHQTYSVIGFRDQRLRWVSASGKLYYDSEGNAAHFSGVIMDITEQKQDDMRKNDFIGMVSHELKTPLTSLSAYVQLMEAKSKKSGDSFGSGAMAKALLQVNKMKSMINGFLNISRLESGKIHLEKQQFDLNQLIIEIIEESEFVSSTHIIDFEPKNTHIVHADRDKIGNVILNLLSNAMKYSDDGKTISIACETFQGKVQVSIADQGKGISQQDQVRLFDRFYRVDNMDNKTISGFGIGLYLSAEIVNRHQGEMWVESELGKGSQFFFNIPIK